MKEFYTELLTLEKEALLKAQSHLNKAWEMLLEALASGAGSRNPDLLRQAQDSVEACAAWVGRCKDNITRYEAEI